MITLDMSRKGQPVVLDIEAFSAEDGVLSLQVSLGDYDLTGRTVTASFSPRDVETGLLTVSAGLVVIPIGASLIQAGTNWIQLNIRKGQTLEQSPLMTWAVSRSLPSTVPAQDDVDIITSLVAQVTSATESLDSVRAACDADAASASASASTATESLNQLNSQIGTSIASLVDGKLNPNQIPIVSIVDTFTVASTAEMVRLTAQRGDNARIVVNGVITDCYSLGSDDPTVLANWVKWGTGWVPEAGHTTSADAASDSDKVDGHHLWSGTQAEYDALTAKDAATVYLVG